MNLQSIIDLIPKDIKFSDIKFSSQIQASDMAVEGNEFIIYYEKLIPADPEGFKLAMEKYNIDLADSLIKMKEYEEYQTTSDRSVYNKYHKYFHAYCDRCRWHKGCNRRYTDAIQRSWKKFRGNQWKNKKIE